MNDLELYKVASVDAKKTQDLLEPTVKALALYLNHISELDVVNNSSAKEASSVMDTLVSILKLILPSTTEDEDNPDQLMKQFKELLNAKKD